MEGGEQPARLRIVRIECKQFLQCSGRPAVLAGIHMRDGFFEQSAFLAVTDNTPLVRAQGGFLLGFLGGSLVGSHVLNLSRSSTTQTGFHGCFQPGLHPAINDRLWNG